jgi:DNA-binding response OmpR family regulator
MESRGHVHRGRGLLLTREQTSISLHPGATCATIGCRRAGATVLRYLFEGYALDTGRRELRRGDDLVPIEPQVFDLLAYLVSQRDRVVSKDDLLTAVWKGRIVSKSALTTRINWRAVIMVLGDVGGGNFFQAVPALSE